MSAPEVEALVEKWAAVLVECKAADPRWILDRSVMTLETALRELRAALAADAVAEPLVALGGERGNEGEQRIADGVQPVFAYWVARAERAEADLAAAEQRGAERAMAVIRERLDKATLHNVNPTEGYALWAVTLRDLDPILDNALRADRLATQAADPASDPTDGD